MSQPRLCAVTPCMGRLAHLRETAPRVVAQMDYCLVDYGCPEDCGTFVREHYPRALVETVRGVEYFNKSRAHNLGARRAIAAGFTYLCFLDADTLIGPDFAAYVEQAMAKETFLIAPIDDPNLCGLLVVAAEQFLRVRGFDEGYDGWGHEDVDMRLRLRLVAGMDFAEIPGEHVSSLPHPDSLRTSNYPIKDKAASAAQSQKKLFIKLFAMSNDPKIVHRPDIMRLLRVRRWGPSTSPQ